MKLHNAAIAILILVLGGETFCFVRTIDQRIKWVDYKSDSYYKDASYTGVVTLHADEMGVHCPKSGADFVLQAPDAAPLIQRALDTMSDWQRMNGSSLEFVFPTGVCLIGNSLRLRMHQPGSSAFRNGTFIWSGPHDGPLFDIP